MSITTLCRKENKDVTYRNLYVQLYEKIGLVAGECRFGRKREKGDLSAWFLLPKVCENVEGLFPLKIKID